MKAWLFLRLLFICGANTNRLRYATLRHHIHGGDTHRRTPPMASATASSCSLLRLPPSSSFPLSRRRDATSTSRRRALFPAVASVAGPREEEIVIVGAGIAGLATALSLHRSLSLSSAFLLWCRCCRGCDISRTLAQARDPIRGAGARGFASGGRHLADALQERMARLGFHWSRGRAPRPVPADPRVRFER